jgi:hypothetical protein
MNAAPIELGRRLMRVDVAYTVSRMQVIEARPGNPFGIAIKLINDVTALMARELPSPNFNRVVGLRDGHEEVIGPLDDWYRANHVRGRFEMMPGDFTPALGQALARRGYAQTAFDTVLYGAPGPPASGSAGVDIVTVRSADVMEEFLDAYLAGWGLPAQHCEGARANMRGWLAQPDWRLYLARIDGKPAAGGILYLKDDVGYFADAATDPEFRCRGAQTALLSHRTAAARQAGVEFVYSRATFGSTSHRNMERIGLRVLHTRAIWTAVD